MGTSISWGATGDGLTTHPGVMEYYQSFLNQRLCSDTVLVKTVKVKTVAHHGGPVVKLKLTERPDTVVVRQF